MGIYKSFYRGIYNTLCQWGTFEIFHQGIDIGPYNTYGFYGKGNSSGSEKGFIEKNDFYSNKYLGPLVNDGDGSGRLCFKIDGWGHTKGSFSNEYDSGYG